MQLSQLTVLGTGELMPALVYGFELDESSDTLAELGSALPDGPPDWLISTWVQAGGYSMSYYSVMGAVFRFADNAHLAFQDPAPFIRLFRLMAEAPDVRAIEREFPALRDLCGTWGEAYSPAQLGRLERWIRKFFAIPSPRSGLEAFVRLGHPDAEQMLGWTHLRVKSPPQKLQDGDARAAVTTGGTFGKPERDVLRAIGTRIRAQEPELCMVWENSD